MFSKIKKYFIIKDYLLLILGLIWVTFNVYFLPFVVWTAGIVRPWFMLNGLVPYRDFTWVRTPLDLFMLSFWYRLFGVSGESYRLFVYVLLLSATTTFFFLVRYLFEKKWIFPFLFYCIFLFPLFLNAEEGEILIGLFEILLIFFFIIFQKSKKFKWLFLSGLVSGLICITKQNSIIVILAVLLTILFNAILPKRNVKDGLRKIFIFILGVITPIAPVLVYFLYKGALSDFFYYTTILVFKGYIQKYSVVNSEGVWIIFAFLSLLIPFILFYKKIKINFQLMFFIALMFCFSLSSLLPSFLSYRAFPSFGIIAVVAGFTSSLLIKNKNQNTARAVKIVIVTSFAFFIILILSFVKGYVSFIQQNNIAFGQFIIDYGENEYKISRWIRDNTAENEKITNYGSEIIYYLSDRLPKYKYIEPFSYLLIPFDKTAKIFIDNPPSIVVYDTSLEAVHKGLTSWPFIDFMKKNYNKVGSYGDNLIIYKYNSKR